VRRAWLIACAALALAGPARAVTPDEQLRDPKLEARARALSQELRCLVCQNQSIDDSAAPLAHDLRVILRERLAAGDTDRQAVDYLVRRYGDFVLLRPPFQADTWALWLGPAGAGSRLKLVCNSWVFMVTAGVAQAVAGARALGVDPRGFLAAIEGGPLDAPYVHVKSGLMLDGEFPPSFALGGAAKDARLIRTALAGAGVSDRLIAAVLETMDAAAERLPDPSGVDLAALIVGLES